MRRIKGKDGTVRCGSACDAGCRCNKCCPKPITGPCCTGPTGPSSGGETGPTGPCCTGPTGASPPGASTILLWGNDSLNATLDPQWLSPGYSDTISQSTRISIPLPLPGVYVVRNMFVRQNIPGTGVGELVYRLEINGVPTVLAVEMPLAALQAQNTGDAVVATQGAILSLVVEGAIDGAVPRDVVVTMELARLPS